MKLRKTIMALVIALVAGGLAIVGTVSAAGYECSLTGYTYMGGTGFNNANDEYFIAGPMVYDFNGTDMYGFAWLKFKNIGTEPVEEAYLYIDLLGVGSMNLDDASEEYPGIVDVYSPGSTDVEDFTGVADTNALHSTLKADPSTYLLAEDVTMTSNGVWAIDITDIYNAWVAGTQDNNGLILYSDSPNANEGSAGVVGAVGAKFVGLNGYKGTAPYIAVDAPTVSKTSPTDGAKDVASDAVIEITFSEEMDIDTVAAAFDIQPAVSGSFAWSTQNSVCTFSPDSDLAGATTYEITIGSSSTDRVGIPLEAEYVFSFDTEAVNRAPVLETIGNKSVDEGSALSFTVHATDPDGDTVTYSFTSTPEMPGAGLDESTGGFTWTPASSDVGTYTVKVTAADNGEPVKSDQESFTITVGNVNRPPELETIDDKNVDEGETLSFSVSATDPDDDGVTYSFTSDPAISGNVLDGTTGAFSWTPGYDASGTYAVVVTAADNGDPALADQEQFTITVDNVNRAPELETIDDKNVDEGETLGFSVSATDPDGDAVTFSFTSTPEMSGATLDESTGAFSWTPAEGAAGDYTVVVTAADDDLTDQVSFNVSVTDGSSGVIYEVTLTGYTFMGGSGTFITTANSGIKDYMLAQPLAYEYGDKDMWGYAWIKFGAIGTDTVEQAYLVLDLLGVGGMYIEDASGAYPGVLHIYSPGDTDVADFVGGTDDFELREAKKNALLTGTPLVADYTMSSNGTYYVDITDIYNNWASGAANNGLILVSDSENSNPDNALGPVGTKYASLGSSEGAAPYITFKSPEEAPSVVGTSPENAAMNVDVGTSVTISFDKSMNVESVAGAFSMAPAGEPPTAMEDALSWNDPCSEVTFTPADLLDHEITYTVTVDSSAADSGGINLAGDYSFSFTTGAYVTPSPEVTGSPEGTVAVDTVELTISGEGVYAYSYALDDGDWSDACHPSQTLSLTGLSDGTHTLKVKIMDSLKNWTDLDDITWTVMAPPRVVSVFPEAGAMASVTDIIEVVFSEEMDRESVEAVFAISPVVAGALSWEGGTCLVFTPETFLEIETGYTVTIGDTAADPAGNTLAEAFTWSFTTLTANTVACSVSADTYVLFGGMGSGVGYPQGTSMGENKLKAGAVSIVDARILMRFDLSPMTDMGLTAEDIESAHLVYTMLDNTDNMDVGPPAPDGTDMYGFIHVLDTETQEKTGDTVDPFFWTEEVQGGDGYVDMNNKPWYVPGAPYVLLTHNTGPYSTGKVDVAPIVRGWMDGRWENNGLELRDQDDQSWVGRTDVFGAEYGDGYSWHLVSREDTEDVPYLMVAYDTDKLRIHDRAASSEAMLPGETRDLTASGGSGSYEWQVTGPDGSDLTASLLSASTGSPVTFTAPETYGLVSVTLASGDESDEIHIGIGSPAAGSSDQAPLYLDPDTPEEKQDLLIDICSDALDQLGGFGSLSRINLDEDGNDALIGGTASEDGAKMLITAVDSPSALDESKYIFFETISGLTVTIEITADSLASDIQQIYVVALDTGNSSPGDASGLFLFGLYDENGNPLADEDIAQLRITIPYNADVTGDSDPFSLGAWKIVHADDMATFFSGDPATDNETVDTGNIVEVDETDRTVTFDTDHCSVFGAVSGTETEVPESVPDDSLGGGCFIGGLF